ncbi:MAG: DNA-formamidopyrimidine glycosylase [Candidatus Atelocyanobacterium thalassa]
MPELPEVESICRKLNELTAGHTIWGGQVLLPRSLAYPFSVQEFCNFVDNINLKIWSRRGKYLLAELDSNKGWMVFHLRMTGQLLWTQQSEPFSKHTRLRFFCTSSYELRFVDIRTFGKVWLIPPSHNPEDIVIGLKKLGIEPLSDDFSVNYLTEKLTSYKRNIKTLLLDQSIIAGIGNIYADEALFRSGIHPETKGIELNIKQIKNLRKAIIEVLNKSIEKGGTTFSNFLNITGNKGNYAKIAWVYGRSNMSCRICNTSIKRIKLSGRSSHFCPKCQQYNKLLK